MKKSVKIVLGAFAVIMAAVCVACILYIIQYIRGNDLNNRLAEELAPVAAVVVPERVETVQPSEDDEQTAANDEAEEPQIERQTFRSVDFDALHDVNTEIHGWIEIPNTLINYAVVQSADDDEFYSDHAVDRSYYSGGSIFSQRYNSLDFSDSVTVLYGHNRKNGTMFATLNNYADPEYFASHGTVYIYMSDAVYEYAVFAAYPHSSEHLLLCHDFDDEDEFNAYFDSLKDSVNTNYNRDMFPEFGDKVLTLSTCYKQNRMQRYLVQAKLVGRYLLTVGTAE